MNIMHYKSELFAWKTPYLQWLKEQEAQLSEKYQKHNNDKNALGKQIYRLPFYSCMDSVIKIAERDIKNDTSSIYLFIRQGGQESVYAQDVISDIFSSEKGTVFAYADEDYLGSLEELYNITRDEYEDTGCYRGRPWFKPDFSPDTLHSFFYIGSIFAIRGDKLFETIQKYGNNISLYSLVYNLLMNEMVFHNTVDGIIVHIPQVLYTNNSLDNSNRLEGMNVIKTTDIVHEELVSVIIPSKDNASVLGKCIDTFIKYTQYKNYEIIIVDNGSCNEQKMCIEQFAGELKNKNSICNITYIYEEMDFNFSKMCNIGAGAANGKYLLFLNDDIEIMNTDKGGKWLEYMLDYVCRKHVGAVGAKLYYPQGRKIQHAGITNMGIGPAHKLCGMEDEGCLYYGHNSVNYDMIAVTAACMLVKRSDFESVGGFDEEFAVAYNDVELCFKLYEKGLYNVQVNDAVLIHHESLSRGADTSYEKQKRLCMEKNKLYEKHPLLKEKDPFYSPNLVQWKKDIEYNSSYLYACDKKIKTKQVSDKEKHKIFKKYDFKASMKAGNKTIWKIYSKLTGNNLPQMNIESVEENDNLITINGWYVVADTDNAYVDKKLWLIRTTKDSDYRKTYEFEAAPKLREDVAQVFESETSKTKNTALSGIQIIFDKKELIKGEYRIGVITNKKHLLCEENMKLHIL